VTALAGSGLPSDAFYFGGFLAVKSGRRTRELSESLDRRETSIFYESPHRLAGTLEILQTLAPDREICVARELTKRFETYHRGSAAELSGYFSAHPPKGEITLLIRGAGRD
jgi:16S rRNA (cytidine1402-2'-O)-methyltransferase